MTPNLIAQKYVEIFEKSYGEIALIDVVTKAVDDGAKRENERCIKLLEERAERTTPDAREIYLIAIEVIRSREEGK